MCGIAGIVDLEGRPVDAASLERMSRRLAHRGPDGEGLFCDGNVGLSHRRLAIIDPGAGVQPFYSDDGLVVLSYNGEVYNYVELRRELEADRPFRTQSDTEVVLRAYEKWGIACLERFRGMFALALYDGRARKLYLVRDRVGIKPLFYYRTPRRLVFASELQAVLAAGDVRREVDPAALCGYFRYQYVPAPATIYRNLHKLEPGCYLEVDTRRGTICKVRYWSLKVNILDRTEDQWLEELEAVLHETLGMYVRSDVPFGAFLSGGVDSSLVTALMAGHLDRPVRTFTIGFREERHSELPYAAEAARSLGTCHCEKVVSPDQAGEVLRTLAAHFGEPFADSSSVPCYYVSQEAARSVKMVLSGDGGDELFGGYLSYQTTFRDHLAQSGPRPAALLRLLSGRWLPPAVRRWAAAEAMRFHRDKHDASRQIFRDGDLKALLVPGLPLAPAVDFRPQVARGEVDAVTYFGAHDFGTYLVDDVLTKVDRTSMANSLEVRVPLLDHKVVELAFSMPLAMKIRCHPLTGELETKHALKRIASRYFPRAFLARPKQGFGIPIVEWCQGPLRPWIESSLRCRRQGIYDWIRFDCVGTMLDDFFSGRDSLVARVWFVFMFHLWEEYVHQDRLEACPGDGTQAGLSGQRAA